MYAIARINSFNPEMLAESPESLDEFAQLHAAQPGFVTSVVVDLDAGRRFILNLWESEEHAEAGMRVLVPEVQRLVNPLLSAPSEFVGAGPVISPEAGVTVMPTEP